MKNLLWLSLALMVAGCGQQNTNQQNETEPQKKAEIKPAVKLGTDASKIGTDTYQFISVVDSLLMTGTPDRTQFEQLIFQPARQLLLRWGMEIKRTDSVVGDEYTICKAALVSLDSWGRAVLDHPSIAKSKQQVYENQKMLCGKVVNGG